MSSLALGCNEVEIKRGMTTSSTAIFIPFMTRELRMDGQALYYGMNALSHNVIMADRKKLKSANGMYLGSTGSGRSKFKKFAVNVWGISDLGRTEEETACEGVEALAGFIKEVGLPATLRDIGADENTDLKRIADSCILSVGSYKQMTHKEILEIFQECY